MERTSPRLSVRAAPRTALVVTPQMRLALELLSLPALDLARRLEHEALANPALELETADAAPDADEAAAPHAAEQWTGAPSSWDATAPERAFRLRDFATRETWSADRLDVARAPSLAEFLRGQLVGRRLAPDAGRALGYLIGCVDERGRLLCSPEEAALDLGLPVADLEGAGEILRSLEPPGIGARDLRECLLLQLRARGRTGTTAWRILEEAFDLLAGRRLSAAARRLGLAVSDLSEGLDEIRRLVPHPGRLVAGEPVRYIVPDLLVQRVDDEFLVCPEDRASPRLRIGRAWRDLAVVGTEADSAAREFAAGRYRAARRLIRAVDRRRGTMVRVMECIVREQRAFFERGTAFLRPMTMKMVAARVGLHESTVARVVREKYAQTPLGLFPLRHFFSGSLGGSGRPGTSGRAVRERIRRWIETEDPARPLTDEGLAGLLEEEGLAVARRTVAKYRNSLGIEQARLRRLRPRRVSRGVEPEPPAERHHPL